MTSSLSPQNTELQLRPQQIYFNITLFTNITVIIPGVLNTQMDASFKVLASHALISSLTFLHSPHLGHSFPCYCQRLTHLHHLDFKPSTLSISCIFIYTLSTNRDSVCLHIYWSLYSIAHSQC